MQKLLLSCSFTSLLFGVNILPVLSQSLNFNYDISTNSENLIAQGNWSNIASVFRPIIEEIQGELNNNEVTRLPESLYLMNEGNLNIWGDVLREDNLLMISLNDRPNCEDSSCEVIGTIATIFEEVSLTESLGLSELSPSNYSEIDLRGGIVPLNAIYVEQNFDYGTMISIAWHQDRQTYHLLFLLDQNDFIPTKKEALIDIAKSMANQTPIINCNLAQVNNDLSNWRSWQGVGKPCNVFARYEPVDDNSFKVGIAPYDINNGVQLLDNQPILPNLQTTFYTHGWRNDHQDPLPMATSMLHSRAIEQAIMVDWGQGAKTFLNLDQAANRINAVARALAEKILESGLKPEEVNLTGHSLGAYVSMEAAVILFQEYGFAVNSVNLLDPAKIDLQWSYTRSDLSRLSPNTATLAIYDIDTGERNLIIGEGNVANDEDYAQTANRYIKIQSRQLNSTPTDSLIEIFGRVLRRLDPIYPIVQQLRVGHGIPVLYWAEILEEKDANEINAIRRGGNLRNLLSNNRVRVIREGGDYVEIEFF